MATDPSQSAAPAVSVLLPAFNAENYLVASVESLLAQTFTDFEIVVIDDGSTDSTPALVRELIARDPRVRVITHHVNQGLVVSLNDGLAAARGELIARLDADDTSCPRRLERQVRVFEDTPDAVLCATAYDRVDPAGHLIRTACPPLTHAALASALLTGNCLCHSSVMFRRSTALSLGGYHAEWFPAEDYDLWLRLLERGRYRGINTVEVRYLENPGGVSSSSTTRQTDIANRRAAEYVAQWCEHSTDTNAAAAIPTVPRGTWRNERAAVRGLQQAALGIAADLRRRGIDTGGLWSAPLGSSLQMLRGHHPLFRQLLLFVYAPRLAMAGRIDRIHSR